MSTFLSVLIGGLLAILGGFLQAIFADYRDTKRTLFEKRQEAYLSYINALNSVKVNEQDLVNHNKYFPKLEECSPRLKLYGSNSIIGMQKSFEADLYECFEASGFDVVDINLKANRIIDAMRKELKIE
jgi:hypothetical protein